MNFKLSDSTRHELSQLVLSDGLPDILEFLSSVCDAEAKRVFELQMAESRKKKNFWDSEECRSLSKLHMFWNFVFRQSSYVIEETRKTIRHRGMTDQEIDAENKAAEIERAEAQLERLRGKRIL